MGSRAAGSELTVTAGWRTLAAPGRPCIPQRPARRLAPGHRWPPTRVQKCPQLRSRAPAYGDRSPFTVTIIAPPTLLGKTGITRLAINQDSEVFCFFLGSSAVSCSSESCALSLFIFKQLFVGLGKFRRGYLSYLKFTSSSSSRMLLP